MQSLWHVLRGKRQLLLQGQGTPPSGLGERDSHGCGVNGPLQIPSICFVAHSRAISILKIEIAFINLPKSRTYLLWPHTARLSSRCLCFLIWRKESLLHGIKQTCMLSRIQAHCQLAVNCGRYRYYCGNPLLSGKCVWERKAVFVQPPAQAQGDNSVKGPRRPSRPSLTHFSPASSSLTPFKCRTFWIWWKSTH